MNLGAELTFFIAAFSALITIVNPFSTVPIFLSITTQNTPKEKIAIARRASITAILVLITFALIGNYILSFFSITIDAFKVAGGIYIAGIGWIMLTQGKQHFRTTKEHREAIKKEDTSITPVAIPFLSGPGAITTTIVLMQETQTIFNVATLLITILLIGAISYILLAKATLLNKYLTPTRQHVIEKLMGLIVLVVGVQFVANGIQGFLHAWL